MLNTRLEDYMNKNNRESVFKKLASFDLRTRTRAVHT